MEEEYKQTLLIFKMNRKAQIGTLQTVIIVLTVVGLVLGLGLLMLEEFEDTMDDVVATVTNETVNATDGAFLAFNSTTAGIDCWNTISISTVWNGSEAAGTITSGNYTISTDGLLSNITGEYSDTNWNVTYTYQHGAEGCSAVQDTTDAIGDIPTWLVIIAIMFVVGILLAIVFRVLPPAGGGGGGAFSLPGRGGGRGGTIAEI